MITERDGWHRCQFGPSLMKINSKRRETESAREMEADDLTAAYCTFWNEHYCEVAEAATPEFQRLNVLFELSVALKLAQSEGLNSSELAGSTTAPTTTRSFATWFAQATQDKQIEMGVSLPILTGVEGAPEDSLPTYSSKPVLSSLTRGKGIWWVGGENGATGETIREATARPDARGLSAVRWNWT